MRVQDARTLWKRAATCEVMSQDIAYIIEAQVGGLQFARGGVLHGTMLHRRCRPKYFLLGRI